MESMSSGYFSRSEILTHLHSLFPRATVISNAR
jgi:hypothetical protein